MLGLLAACCIIWIIRKIRETTYNSLPHTPQIGLILLLLFVVYLAELFVKIAPNKGTGESLWTMTDYRWPIDIVFSLSIYGKSAVRSEKKLVTLSYVVSFNFV